MLPNRQRAGFTLVEVLMTVSILALLMSVGVVSLTSLIKWVRLKEATTLLSGAVRDAQAAAIGENQLWRVVIDADGGGFSLQRAIDSSANYKCSSTGWSQADQKRSHRFSASIHVIEQSQQCMTFFPSGLAAWKSPRVMADRMTNPRGGSGSPLRLTDGSDVETSAAGYDTRRVWWNPDPITPVVVPLDVGDARRFRSVRVGLHTAQDIGVGYPDSVELYGAPAGPYPIDDSALVLLSRLSAGQVGYPQEPIDGSASRAWLELPISDASSYQYLKLKIYAPSTVPMLDEIQVNDLIYVLFDGSQKRTLTVRPITGTVTVK